MFKYHCRNSAALRQAIKAQSLYILRDGQFSGFAEIFDDRNALKVRQKMIGDHLEMAITGCKAD
jgi:hypothetical protein